VVTVLRAFIGDGPVRLDFVANRDEGNIVVGVRVFGNDPTLEFEIISVKVDNSHKFYDNLTEAIQRAEEVRLTCVFLQWQFVRGEGKRNR